MTQNNKNVITPKTTGFTLIEILVVIAIIAVLAGILLAALSSVQSAAKKTKTEALMQSFARACDSFALDHGRYPGLLPEAAIDGTMITSMQNAMLELMGGARAMHNQSPVSVADEYNSFADNATVTYEDAFTDQISGLTWSLVFDETRFGEGPWIAGRVYEPYFSPKSRDLQYKPYDSNNTSYSLPSLIDAWDTPILYFRAGRKHGPIIADPATNSDPTFNQPQYDLPGFDQYITDALNTNISLLSIDSATGQAIEDRLAWLTLLLAHPTFWEITTGNAGSEFNLGVAWGTTRGRYMMISAGPDKVYLEVTNKQIHINQTVMDPSNPFGSITGGGPQGGAVTPAMMETFDDVVIHGGA
ncbi:MAG: prepilin-type N-terminal cleavage/methylation domain-containing protein [Planctomycetota bacterium]|nr:prepilin-type N-terminal cleavage/methylation domain-containing protein [Planctomycetota bacterium]